jgi:acetyl-CoA hydrolase
MSALHERTRKQSLHAKIMRVEDTVRFFRDGQNLGFSGFGGGHPKAVAHALADYVESKGLQGKMRFSVYTGASIGRDIDNRWAGLGMMDRRCPYQAGDTIRKEINKGNIRMIDRHLSHYAQEFTYNIFPADRGGKVDIALIEATGITEDGGIILSSSVGISPEIIQCADKIIIEINTAVPNWEGVHDIFLQQPLPHRQPLLISGICDRIGTPHVPCDSDKIIAIVESTKNDPGRPMDPVDEGSRTIANHIIEFFKSEVKAGRLPKNLLPLQSGVGNIANAVVSGLVEGPFTNLRMWTEIMQDTALDFFDSGKLDMASATSFGLSAEGIQRLYDNWDRYMSKIVLRPVQISNHPELVRRFGVIGMNTPVEFDIYAHCNSTMVGGSRIVNGIGGSGDFLRNAHLSIMHSPSVRPTPNDPTGITCVVPMATHVDHTEHDLDVLVTEQGLADLRGLCPKDRAQVVIDKCVHPDYKPIMQEYFDRAKRECTASMSAHEPHLLRRAFKMQQNFCEKGTMKIDNWD